MVVFTNLVYAILLAVGSTAYHVSIDGNSFLQLFAHSRSDESGIVAEWIGCYNDDSDHDLEYNPSGQFSVTGCMKECLYVRYNFMALQDRGLCWCGNSYGTAPQYSKLQDSQCDSTCENRTKSDENARCGRRFANAIYEIKAQNPAATTTTGTTITASSTTVSTITATSTTVTTTAEKMEGEAEQKTFLHDNTCRDQEVTNFTIGGHPVHCSKLLHYCMKPEKTEAMQSSCPASCGLCKPYWIGCFHDDPDEHDFDVHPPGQHTTRTCMQACAGFKYMGLQSGSECWCGMEYSRNVDRYFQVLDADCGDVCEGEGNMTPTRYCGATKINAVYRLPIVQKAAKRKKPSPETNQDVRLSTPGQTSKVAISEWKGCFKDTPDRPFLVQPRGKHTTKSCMLACMNFTYIALQNMGTCWCGNSYVKNSSKHEQLQDKMCGDVCHGEASLKPVRYCGGAQANAVYQLKLPVSEQPNQIEDSTPKTEMDDPTPKKGFNYDSTKAKQVYSTFMQFDGNHDGVVTEQELETILMVLDDGTWNEARIAKLISDLDQNNDHQLQLSEFEAFFDTMHDMKNTANDVSGQLDDHAAHMPMFPVTQATEQATTSGDSDAGLSNQDTKTSSDSDAGLSNQDTKTSTNKTTSEGSVPNILKDPASLTPNDVKDMWKKFRDQPTSNSSVPLLPKEAPVAVHISSADMTNSSSHAEDGNIRNMWKQLREEAGNSNVSLP